MTVESSRATATRRPSALRLTARASSSSLSVLLCTALSRLVEPSSPSSSKSQNLTVWSALAEANPLPSCVALSPQTSLPAPWASMASVTSAEATSTIRILPDLVPTTAWRSPATKRELRQYPTSSDTVLMQTRADRFQILTDSWLPLSTAVLSELKHTVRTSDLWGILQVELDLSIVTLSLIFQERKSHKSLYVNDSILTCVPDAPVS